MKFAVGDKVKIISLPKFKGEERKFFLGKVGVVEKIDGSCYPIKVSIPGISKDMKSTYWNEDELEIVEY